MHRHTGIRRGLIGAAASTAVTLLTASAAFANTSPPPGTPTATPSAGSSAVGALFPPGSNQHSCTGTVIDSLSGDLVLTAAHCVSGSGAGWTFAPDWRNGSAPEGKWLVTAAYALGGWINSGNPQDDMALLKVAPQNVGGQPRTLQSVTDAAYLGFAPRTGQQITDIAYNDGASTPVTCDASTYWTDRFPTFNCGGYVNGSSGSPWLVGTGRSPSVVGIIGGLHQGGCYDYTSYSPAFHGNIVTLWLRAEFSRSGDTLPVAGSDGC